MRKTLALAVPGLAAIMAIFSPSQNPWKPSDQIRVVDGLSFVKRSKPVVARPRVDQSRDRSSVVTGGADPSA